MGKYKRLLLKISGEALGGESGKGLSPSFLESLAEEIKNVLEYGIQLGIVVGGGNFFRGGEAAKNGMERGIADQIGMLATMMNALALQDIFMRKGIKNQIFSALEINRLSQPIHLPAIRHFVSKKGVAIMAGGVGSPYFTTDTAAVLRALEIKADVICKATKVDGIYDKDPIKYKDAQKFDTINYDKAISLRLKVMDQTAFALCQENRLPIVVFKLAKGNILKIVKGEKIGTLVKGGS